MFILSFAAGVAEMQSHWYYLGMWDLCLVWGAPLRNQSTIFINLDSCLWPPLVGGAKPLSLFYIP